LTVTDKISFEKIYRIEKGIKVKEKMLLVLNVVYHGNVAAHVAEREIVVFCYEFANPGV
jgi:hypothetical protein